jgi:hypothetical protein
MVYTIQQEAKATVLITKKIFVIGSTAIPNLDYLSLADLGKKKVA